MVGVKPVEALSLLPSFDSVFEVDENSKVFEFALDANLSAPLGAPFFPKHTVVTRCVVGFHCLVSGIGRSVDRPKIVPSVVGSTPVDVINFDRVFTSHPFPDDSVCYLSDSEDCALQITIASGCESSLASQFCIPLFRGK